MVSISNWKNRASIAASAQSFLNHMQEMQRTQAQIDQLKRERLESEVKFFKGAMDKNYKEWTMLYRL